VGTAALPGGGRPPTTPYYYLPLQHHTHHTTLPSPPPPYRPLPHHTDMDISLPAPLVHRFHTLHTPTVQLARQGITCLPHPAACYRRWYSAKVWEGLQHSHGSGADQATLAPRRAACLPPVLLCGCRDNAAFHTAFASCHIRLHLPHLVTSCRRAYLCLADCACSHALAHVHTRPAATLSSRRTLYVYLPACLYAAHLRISRLCICRHLHRAPSRMLAAALPRIIACRLLRTLRRLPCRAGKRHLVPTPATAHG